MMEKLKKCPFCGNQYPGTSWDNEWPNGYWYIVCGAAYGADKKQESCRQKWGRFETEEEAIIAWNKRADDK